LPDPPLLTVDGIRASIGSYTVLSDVTLSVTAGKTTVVLGRNGAGKTTTLRTIIGFIKPTAGSVRFEGEPIDNLRVHEIVRRGIAYVPEDRGVFGPLSVEENLRLAAPPDADWDSVLELFPILRERMAQRAGQLSGGQQQMLTVARALLQRPKLLILDEPSKGLAPLLVDELMTALQTLSQQTTILVVEQNLAAARKLGDRFVVIDDGVTVAQGDIDELAADDGVVERFLTLSAVSSADQGA
jgi:branched-chain amino acid transport system ATP-binding protein